ncbi:Leucine--tRNA ligase [Sulfuracidifex tepidarius]|uniref:Leucine--tRNA ligase n=2 Tax=Sulfuracidifex tepidarius TaxID=1294262 RepID=A0A510E2M4_9CREN|nr:Leucine--tRNA ligase [Sulfuracidifex tepidarius]
MHIGHGRSYVTADVYSRFKRMAGYNVLFPMAFHFTGTPIIAMADDVAKGDKELISIFKEIYEIPDSVIPKLSEPLFMATYFKEDIKKAMKELGLGIDWRREFTTIDPEFSTFVLWQFQKLHDKGYIVRDTHPVGWCPVHNIPVGMHDTKGDMEPEIGEYVLIYFNSGDLVLPAATLRPETVFGVVAIWINPNEKYKVIEAYGKKMLVSERAALKFSFQTDNVKEIDEIKGSELKGREAVNPVTGSKVPILGADFVDPMMGTGVVMSVPAHAPFDYFYVKKVKPDLKIIPVVKLDGYSEIPASDLVEKNNPSGKEDLQKLTEQLYRQEYNKGKVRDDVLNLAKAEYVESLKPIVGMSVPEARKLVTDFIISSGLGRKIYEIMNRPVYCRCGNEVVVKILKDQWFLDYGNEEWKSLARKLLYSMRVIPEEARKEFEYALGWLEKRACARTRGLGTPLPWDKKWIIESLSDSTIYMAFYTVAHKIREYKILPSQMKTEFWDYVMLGIGDLDEISSITGINKDVIEELRKEFNYWYPLDFRHSGRDLVPNHLSFFIFNHAGIFPEEKWPRGVAVNGLLLYEGKKMSKSLRNIVPLRKSIRMYSADLVRAVLSATADMGSDVNFSESLVKSIGDSYRYFLQLAEQLSSFTSDQHGFPERWISSVFNFMERDVTKYMEEMNFRDAFNEAVFVLNSQLQEYFELVKSEGRSPNGELMRHIVSDWVKIIAPFSPHFAEEMWHKLGNKSLVVTEPWVKPDLKLIDEVAEMEHEYLERLVYDVKSILSIYKGKPNKATILVSNEGQFRMLREAIMSIERGEGMKGFMGSVKPSKAEMKYAQKVFNYAMTMDEKLKKFIKLQFNEIDIAKEISPYLKAKLGIEVEIRSYDKEDLEKFKKEPLPMKPAIIID